MTENDIYLVRTCNFAPEQYDAYINGEQVGYLRLRWGSFTVECPDVGGECVYEASPRGESMFLEQERERYLREAKKAIASYWNRTQKGAQT